MTASSRYFREVGWRREYAVASAVATERGVGMEVGMGRFVKATDVLMDYLSRVGAREVPAQVNCREETQKMPMGMMQIAPEQGAFLALLARLTEAKRYVEIGTFTGYSALSVALAMPPDGKIVALDVNKAFTDRARGYWKEAGVENKIDLRL